MTGAKQRQFRGRRSEGGGQRGEVRGGRSEGGGQRWEGELDVNGYELFGERKEEVIGQ